MNPRRGSIRIRDLKVDGLDELGDIARIYFDGFSTTVVHQLIFPGGGSASARESFVRALRNDLTPNPSSASPVQVFMKVAELVPVHDEGGDDYGQTSRAKPKIIAIARWVFVKEPLSPEMLDVRHTDQKTQEELGEGANLEVWRKFMGVVLESRKKMHQGRCLHLGTMVCDPEYRGLGAASALLQWGVDFADRTRVPAFLESSPYGHRLYERFGFEDVDALDVPLESHGVRDEKDWGAELCVPLVGEKPKGSFRVAIMKRSPR